MNNFVFHQAERADSKLLSTLFKTVYIETYGIEGITHEFSDFIEHQFSPDKIERDMASNDCHLWVARFKNNPVGILQAEYKKDCPIGNFTSPEINKLYILRNFSGLGIGQNLMKRAEKQIRSNGYNKVWLWVLESNKRAIDFYRLQGYRGIGTSDFQMAVNRYTNVVMLKDLW